MLTVLCRGQSDVFFECRAEMTVIQKSHAVTDRADGKLCVHEQVLRLTDFPVHDCLLYTSDAADE